jgi:hypothetical protein
MVKDRLKRLFPESEVSAIAIENIGDSAAPLKVRYHLRAPLYAQGAGRRMFFPVFPFQRAETSPFAAADRRYPIMLPYGWQETDEITIQLPPGTALDSADSPGPLTFAPTGKLDVAISIGSNGVLLVKRDFVIGENSNVMFAAANYPALKQLFAEIQKRNAHTMALTEAK